MSNQLKNKLLEGYGPPKVWSLRTNLMLDDSLGLTGLRKAVILIVVMYYREKIQIKISKGEKHMDDVQEKQDTSFQVSAASGVA